MTISLEKQDIKINISYQINDLVKKKVMENNKDCYLKNIEEVVMKKIKNYYKDHKIEKNI